MFSWFNRKLKLRSHTQQEESSIGMEENAPSKADTVTDSKFLNADRPIQTPAQDIYGFDPFASAIAVGIAGLKSPEGLVIGLHGRWGSGKSSAVNLIKHHLGETSGKSARNITIIEFNPWWFSGQDALSIAFFSEVGATINKSLPEKARDAFQYLGQKIGIANPLITAAINLATAGTGGAVAGGALSLINGMFGSEKTTQTEHARLSEALSKIDHRFLVIIDDIDRLLPDETLLIFKLIKSVGRLPNMVYLLVFDRELAERTVAEHFPSEGPHFLEKIIQASFELPTPESTDLRNQVLQNAFKVMGEPSSDEMVRFMNNFYEIVAPDVRLPRDVIRLTNAIQVTWPAVAGEVNKADFLAIESVRLNHPATYRNIYQNKDLVCGFASTGRHQGHESDFYNQRLLSKVPEEDIEHVKNLLKKLFPKLEGVWGNHFYDGGFSDIWRRERRICTSANFDTYFRLAVSDQVIPAAELQEFFSVANDAEKVKEKFLMAASIPRRQGGTRASVLLEELTAASTTIPDEVFAPLVYGIFEVADEIDVPADEARGFSNGSNSLRIHWLINRLIGRFDEEKRNEIFEEAVRRASFSWASEFTLRCVRQHLQSNNVEHSQDTPIVSESAAERLRSRADSAHSGS